MSIAIILSGCGVYDGSEIHETVLVMNHLAKHGLSYECFAPDAPIPNTINHLTETQTNETRHMRIESARIARGHCKSLSAFDGTHHEAIIFPGGFGVAKNLSNFAAQGTNCSLHPDVSACIHTMHHLNKPLAFLCIAPILAARTLPGVTLTIGHDPDTAAAIEAMGAHHKPSLATEIVVDETMKVISTPAYMLATGISECDQGIAKLIDQIVDWVK